MMDERQEQREYIGAAWKEFATGPSDHLNEEALIQYHHGQLKDPEQAQVESHLARCAACLETLVDVRDFLYSVSERDETMSEAARDPNFEVLWQRLHPPISSTSEALRPKQIRFLAHPRAMFALVASLFIALALTLIWVLMLRQENQRLADRPSEPGALAGRLSDLEQENRGLREQLNVLQQESRRLQEQINAAQQRYELELAQLKQPTVNVAIRNIYPRDDKPRSTGQGEVNRISVAPGTRALIFVLSDFEPGYQDYEIEMVDQAGRLVWKGEGLRPDEAGDLTLMLDRTFLSQRKYTLKLYGQRGGRSQKIAEYLVMLE
jgi:hypothetical protein